MRPSTALDNLMRTAKHRQPHIARHLHPHLAQEFIDRGQQDNAADITFRLTPHARMCAEGRVSHEYAMRHRLA